jgi:shikimate dehydrogenase
LIISATTRLLALLGDPVAHSLSPAFQNAAIRHARYDAVYVALPCDTHSVGPLIQALCRAGGGGNVTIPHKETAALCIEQPTPHVTRTGACNTFWGQDGVICGDNTDVAGFRQAAAALRPDLRGARVLMVGAGGAAAAAVCALLDDGVAAITLLNRSAHRARALAHRLDPAGHVVHTASSPGEVRGNSYDLVVNASSVGLAPSDPLPMDLRELGEVGAALDLVYRHHAVTPWVQHARSLGVPAADGTGMLVGQGAAAFRHWFQADPSMEVMRAALGA